MDSIEFNFVSIFVGADLNMSFLCLHSVLLHIHQLFIIRDDIVIFFKNDEIHAFIQLL